MATKRILIVGGGSSGWMSAAYLDAALNHAGRAVDIAVLESPDVPRIGVGEATIPSIHHVLAVIGIDEHAFMRRTEGTFKQAIKFVNWLHDRGEGYYHAFHRYTPTPIDDAGPRWLMSDRSIPFMETISPQPRLCEWNLAPQMLGPWDFGPKLTYAFHMNALLFADHLCEIATSRGVAHHRDHMTDVVMHENGDIAAVNTRGGQRLEADLFIDCTGFASLLIEQQLGVRWIDYSQWLLCDRAIVMPVPYDVHYPGFVRPYTQATALSAGWVWDIPLHSRRGVGYVHSSAFVSEEEAERELRAYEGAHAERLSTRVVHFKVGMRERAWFRNCIAIGLSGGFLEPLESTGLYLSDLAAVMLAEHFPWHADMDVMSYRYNRILANRFREVLDFINLHYCLTRRIDTPFWREVQQPDRVNDRLQAKLDFWRMRPVSAIDFQDQFLPGQRDPLPASGPPGDLRSPIDTGKLFTRSSYEAILYGMDFMREECRDRFGQHLPPTAVHRRIVTRVALARQKLPPHDVWLKRRVGMPNYARH
ncbi:MAG TPA: tryptophan halogenase family protein [Woeseiaceae bacterium]|nr:tryptophan halogenase family protein [Woeseiaceae bacterium]